MTLLLIHYKIIWPLKYYLHQLLFAAPGPAEQSLYLRCACLMAWFFFVFQYFQHVRENFCLAGERYSCDFILQANNFTCVTTSCTSSTWAKILKNHPRHQDKDYGLIWVKSVVISAWCLTFCRSLFFMSRRTCSFYFYDNPAVTTSQLH